MSRKREVVLMVEECEACDISTESFCTRHQGFVDELPSEYIVRCISCGEAYIGVPEKGRVNCLNCNKILKEPKKG